MWNNSRIIFLKLIPPDFRTPIIISYSQRSLDPCVSISSGRNHREEKLNNNSNSTKRIFNKFHFSTFPLCFRHFKRRRRWKKKKRKLYEERKLRNRKIEIVSKTARQKSSSNRSFFRSTYQIRARVTSHSISSTQADIRVEPIKKGWSDSFLDLGKGNGNS